MNTPKQVPRIKSKKKKEITSQKLFVFINNEKKHGGIHTHLKSSFLVTEAFDTAAGCVRLNMHGGRLNTALNKCLFTRLPVK